MEWNRQSASFRDPSGFVFVSGDVLYRQVNQAFGAEYRQLIDSGLYGELVRDGLLVPHDEVDLQLPDAPPAFATLRPAKVPFISYPYEWCFGQLKAAAELTLEIQNRALAHGMILRDASAYNVQFIGARPIFIDTLSFGSYREGLPWVAYRQFCTHFLGPLALMAMTDPSMGELSRLHLDGVPLKLSTRLLPLSSHLRPGLLTHLHLHSRSSIEGHEQHTRSGAVPRRRVMGKAAMLGLVDSLLRTVRSLSWEPPSSLWATYNEHSNYTPAAQSHKQQLVRDWFQIIRARSAPATVWDLGANTGVFSRIAAAPGCTVVSFDLDHAAVERHFRACREEPDREVLPLIQNLTNPTSGAGWRNIERQSLEQRGPADVAMALALVHHLVISGHVPLPAIADFFATVCRHLIVEFVPPGDSQVQRMVALREDALAEYSQAHFESAFKGHFEMLRSTVINETSRILYLMARREF